MSHPVRRAFARAAGRYDAAAGFQRSAGEALLAGLHEEPAPARILDLGCGTGHGLGLLAARWPAAELIAADFALPMVASARMGWRHCADAEALPLADAAVDMVWANLVMQWCDPALFLAEAARVLRPGGRLAAATLGPGTFAELRAAFAAADDRRHTIDFAAPAALAAAVGAGGLRRLTLQARPATLHYADLRGLLAGVREIGANRVAGRAPGLMGKAAWRRFEAAYETLRTPAGLPLTYDTILIYAEK
jgi:malonyl-CoA O-methyltransferase